MLRAASCVLALGALTLTACSSQVLLGGEPSDGGRDAAGGASPDDAGAADGWGSSPDGGPWSPLCPENLPAAGTPCAPESAECEYGDGWWNPACDTFVVCRKGAWQTETPYPATCSPPPGPNSASCPAGQGIVSGVCPSDGLTCRYEEGSTCQCGHFDGPDGGITWDCFPGAGCPSTRPRIGSPCASTIGCTYIPCEFDESCALGIWVSTPTGC